MQTACRPQILLIIAIVIGHIIEPEIDDDDGGGGGVMLNHTHVAYIHTNLDFNRELERPT